MRSSVLFSTLLVLLLGLLVFPASGQNLLNADFENWTDDNPDDWTVVESGNNEIQENSFAYSGGSSVKINNVGSTRPRLVQYFSVDPNEQVEASIFVYDNDDSFVRVYVKVYDESNNLLYQEFTQSINTTSWQALVLDFVTPASTTQIKYEILHFKNDSQPLPQVCYVDYADIVITQPTYVSVVNESFEDWTGGAPDYWEALLVSDAAVDEENVIVNSGSASAALSSAALSRPRLIQYLYVRPGDTVGGSAYFAEDITSGQLSRLYLKAYDANNNFIQQGYANSANTTSFTQVSATLETPSSTAWVRYELQQINTTDPDELRTVYVDDVDYWIDTYTEDVSDENVWYLIGVPTIIDDQADRNADALFADDLGGNSTASTWVMSRWNNSTQQYERFGNGDGDPGTEPPDIEPGLGYWFVQAVEPGTPDPRLDITSSQTSGAPSSNVTQTIVANGETMLANPFYGDYELATANLTVGGFASGWGQNGINANIYKYNGQTRQYLIQLATSAVLDPWDGFWVVKTTASDGQIEFVYNPDEHGPVIDDVEEVDEFTDTGWGINLRVETVDGEYQDNYNEFGVRDRSRDGYDGYDAFELTPPDSRYVSLAFVHDDWREGTRFAWDYRDRDFDEEVWFFDVKANRLPNSTLRLHWPTLQGGPQNVEFELMHITPNGIQPVGRLHEMGGEYVFNVGDSQSEVEHFYVRAYDVSRSTDVADESGAALPVEFGISNAYPNPFNAQISVKMGIPEAGETTLKVYDVLGREVARIHDGQLTAGLHTFTWNAQDYASGTYFLQLKAGGKVAHRKITLLQ